MHLLKALTTRLGALTITQTRTYIVRVSRIPSGVEGCWSSKGVPTMSQRGLLLLLDPALTGRTHQTYSGELAWQRDDAGLALQQLAEAGYCCLGGEAWLVLPDGRLYGQIPQRRGVPAVYAWSTGIVWVSAAESWVGYCQRCAADCHRQMATFRPEDEVVEGHSGNIWWNFVFEEQDDYLLHRPSLRRKFDRPEP